MRMLVPVCNHYECEYMGAPKGFCSFQVCARGYPKPIAIKPLTNADRIRSMTDEELAEWLDKHDAYIAGCYSGKCGGRDCKHCWLDWLREEAR